jgi:capsular exopolysaccharide synthesis family protein
LIYQNLNLLPNANGLRSLAITSALAGEGKSTIALGLAISAARLNKRVLLIDADLRRPSLHKQLGLPNEQGLSTLLLEASDTRQLGIRLLHQYNDISIAVLTSGPAPADPVKLLSSGQMDRLLAEFEQAYDLVIFDTPPTLGIVDAVLTASFCDGTLLLGRIGRVTRAELSQAFSALSPVNVVGVVANGSQDRLRYYPVQQAIQPTLSV